EQGTQRSLARGLQNLRRLAVSPDGRWLATAPYWFPAGPITVWDAQTGEHVRDLDSVVNASVTFSPDGKWLGGGPSTEFRFRETSTWTLGPVLRRTQGGESIGTADFSPDGRLLALTISRHDVQLCDAGTGQELALLRSPQPMFLTQPCFSPDGSRLAVTTAGQGIQSWDLRLIRQPLAEIGLDWALPPYRPPPSEGQEPLQVARAELGEIRRLEGHSGPVNAVAFLPDGRHALSGSWDGTLRLWDVETGAEVRRFEGQQITSLALSGDGRRALSGRFDRTVRLWDVETGKELKKLEGHTHIVWSVAFSPDGRRALSGSQDSTVREWDLETGRELHCFKGHIPPSTVGCVAYLSGDRALSTASDRTLSTGPDRTLRLWDLKTGQDLDRFERPDPVTASAAVPRGPPLLPPPPGEGSPAGAADS